MKIQKLFAPFLLGILVHALPATAGDRYLVNIHGTSKAVDGSDKLVGTPFNTTTLIENYVATEDPTADVRHLNLVYDGEGEISIVDSNGTALYCAFKLVSPTVVSNSTATQQERFMFVFVQGRGDAAGSAIVTDRFVRNREGNVVRQSSKGRLYFARPAAGEAGAQVCTGTFSTGKKWFVNSTNTPPVSSP